MSNMMVGENMTEKMYLRLMLALAFKRVQSTCLVAWDAVRRVSWPSEERMTRKIASKNGTMIDVTKSGTACNEFKKR